MKEQVALALCVLVEWITGKTLDTLYLAEKYF